MNKHKWHDEIVAWAAGTKLQYRYSPTAEWVDEDHPNPPWASQTIQFRVKPKTKTLNLRVQLEPEHDQQQVVVPWELFSAASILQESNDNLRLTFDGTKLIKAEVL